ncbi:MAG: DUF1835 domain-containing protein [Roseivirga sp.]|nr:DUF1835 domain-containing protein [Roseivirga sp.]
MSDILHILNGDSTRQIIEQTDISGDLCVWRDVLSDGPTVMDVGSTAFWDTRAAYMSNAFEVSEQEFREKAQMEFEKITAFADYKEVVLWFEYDLFCQINMLAILHWFNQQERGDTKVSLICVGREEGYEKLVGLGELPPEQYPHLFSRRRIMGTADFSFATDVYEAWCSPDPTDLETYTLLPSNEFPYLSAALQSHFRRFPSAQTGLTEIEQKIVNLITSGVQKERQIVGNLLRWQEHYGFGDLQFFQVLDRLDPLLTKTPQIDLKPGFKDLLANNTPVRSIDRDYFLGGTQVADWQWDTQKNELASGRD